MTGVSNEYNVDWYRVPLSKEQLEEIVMITSERQKMILYKRSRKLIMKF